ncbi:hypothetical protein BDDG_04850 [Blastomyces dermatitidis ATCC 18188]|uniref:Uncharacterized protein n=1 Tax=Ajellomyces dermatitidis (strain ATCC 18188 / CBS 674.68) TaxID=653446 RepID=F2TF94_AJEDA|nr:hypothetical protein BDDG_04850 [Blastomyces dermatitidis ATCC 18188]
MPLPQTAALANLDPQHLAPLDALVHSILRIVVFRKFRTEFTSIAELMITLKAVQAYQNTVPSFNNFSLHLLEIAAHTTHALTAELYTAAHPEINVYSTDLRSRPHPHYIIDLLATWAETQVFGGVVLFEHEKDKSDSVLLAAFVHPSQQTGNSVFQLSPSQLTFHQPLPFSATQNVDTLTVHRNDLQDRHIFRDEFSRISPPIILNRPPCIVPLTDEMRVGMNWARQQHEARGKPYETTYYPPQ